MNDIDDVFPTIKKNIENLIEDEEGNIPGSSLLMLGTMMIILGSFFSMDAFAKHSSHSSHSSHTSHVSGPSGPNNSTHESHVSHTSHESHTSHSNTASHSNSLYSAEGDVSYGAPAASSISGTSSTESNSAIVLPDVNSNIESPEATPGIIAPLSVPLTSPETEIDVGELPHVPPETEKPE